MTTNAQHVALRALNEGKKVRTDMIQRLEACGLVVARRETRISGRNGYPATRRVIVGARLTAAGRAAVT